MNFDHKSGLKNAYDRTPARQHTKSVVMREGKEYYSQATELNEMQSIANNRFGQIGGMTAKNGDRVTGCEIIVDRQSGNVLLGQGELYLNGHVLPVAAATLTGVSMSGRANIGCRLDITFVTAEDDETLLGLAPGTAGEGEPGAAREDWQISWGHGEDGATAPFTLVYTLVVSSCSVS